MVRHFGGVLLAWLGAVLVVIAVSLTLATNSATDNEDGAPPIPSSLFNFAYYKQTFGKHYRSFLEEVARQRLFLASAARAWISSIKYKYKVKPYYLSVNNLSDRSQEEKARMRNKYAGLDSEPDTPTQDSRGSMQPEQISGENENVPVKLEGLVREHSGGGGGGGDKLSYMELREALANKEPGLSRKKRDIGKRLRDKYELMTSSNSIGALDKMPQLDDEVFFDHRDSGCLFPPRDQGDCGACYAFVSIAMMEWLYCKMKGKLVAFSEQYMLDCGRELIGKSMDGCEGAHDTAVPEFIHNFGLELGQKYGYRAREGKCPYAKDSDVSKTGTIRMELTYAFKMKRKQFSDYIENSPIYTGIRTNADFDAYGGGVHDGSGCKSKVDHAMLLVGHGREDNIEYWLLRNSYGTGWGVGGYYKLAKSATKKCFDHYGYIFGTKDGQNFSVQPKRTN